jgi:uncharacterized protein (DUF58 family)
MDYRGPGAERTKHARAALIALALSVLMTRGGERIALMGGTAAQARGGRAQLNRMALELAGTRRDDRPDYGAPPGDRMARGGRAVFLSDFLGDLDGLRPALAHAGDQGVRGVFVQVLDESEEAFPFDGRLIFESMGGGTRFETQRARALQAAYQERLAARRAELGALAARLGWRVLFHRTSQSPRSALLWLYMALGDGRG